MNPARAIGGFFRAPPRRRLMALEALAELARARVVTLLPARIYTRDMGVLVAGDAALAAEAADSTEAVHVGRMVEAVARYMPFRALCLQQAIAVRRMLERRGVPSAVCLGVSRDRADRAAAEPGRAAHAWVEVGGRVVSGDVALDRYAIVARFA